MDAFAKNIWNLQPYEKNAFEKSFTSFEDHEGYQARKQSLGVQDIKTVTNGNQHAHG